MSYVKDDMSEGECVGHLGPPSNTAAPHPKMDTCSFWKPLHDEERSADRCPACGEGEALYKQRYQEKAAESQQWAAKAGKHAAENASLREELEEARNEACVRCGFPTHDITSAAEQRAEAAEKALRELVRLKDGPRDDWYRSAKEKAWADARAALHDEERPKDYDPITAPIPDGDMNGPHGPLPALHDEERSAPSEEGKNG